MAYHQCFTFLPFYCFTFLPFYLYKMPIYLYICAIFSSDVRYLGVMKNIVFTLCVAVCLGMVAACTDDDSFSTSPSNLLTFSSDTISMDTVFSTVPTTTRTIWVYNRSGDGIRCTNVRLANGNQTGFRVNVDGEYLSPTAGYQVQNVEIRKGDSIRVFVELTSPNNGVDGPQLLEDELVFSLESGVEQRVNLNAHTWDATFLRDYVVSEDFTLSSSGRPVVIYGGLTVDSLATLTITPGTTLYFHGDAGIDVYGRLVAEGTAEDNIVLRGDRTDWMFDYLPYDMVSGQWQGVKFHGSSYDNVVAFTDIHGTFDGVVCDSSDVSVTKLTMRNSTVHNCQGYGVKAVNSKLDLSNCQITNTLQNCVAVFGGDVTMKHCTLAQFYPFDSNRGAALMYANSYEGVSLPLVRMECVNSIVTGYGEDMVMAVNSDEDGGVPFNYRFVNSLLRTEKVEGDDNLVGIIWEDVTAEDVDTSAVMGEENFRLVDIDMQRYDFHLDSLSYAIGAADKSCSLPDDRDGRQRDDAPDMGCYEFFKDEQ